MLQSRYRLAGPSEDHEEYPAAMMKKQFFLHALILFLLVASGCRGSDSATQAAVTSPQARPPGSSFALAAAKQPDAAAGHLIQVKPPATFNGDQLPQNGLVE